jgi:drug/metabolite transporter (DMT)-like permease
MIAGCAAMSDDRVVSQLDFSGKRHIGVMLILLSAFLYSPVGIFSKAVDADSWSIIFWRGAVAAPAGILFLLVIGKLDAEWCRLRRNARFSLVVIALQAAATAAFIASFKLTSVANVALIWGASPVFAAVIGWLWLRERVTKSFLVAVGLVVAGNAVIVLGSASGQGGSGLAGDALALLMTVLLVTSTIVYRHCPDMPSTLPTVAATLVLMLVASALSSPFAVPLDEIIISALGGITFVMACITLFEGAKYLAPGETALLCITEIPWAIILAILVLAEYPSAQTMTGGAVIMAAVLWYQWRALRSG